MSEDDLLDEDGEFYEWGQELLRLGKELQRLTKGKLKIGSLHPFDKYQDPFLTAKIKGKMRKFGQVKKTVVYFLKIMRLKVLLKR